MNKRQVISSLNKIAEELDNNGLHIEATNITNVMKKLAQQMPDQNNETASAIPPQTKNNLIAMLKNVQSINSTCYSLLTYDTISQSHIDNFISTDVMSGNPVNQGHIDAVNQAKRDITALSNILPLYLGKPI